LAGTLIAQQHADLNIPFKKNLVSVEHQREIPNGTFRDRSFELNSAIGRNSQQGKKEGQKDSWVGADKFAHMTGSLIFVMIGGIMHSDFLGNGRQNDIRFGAGFSLSLGLAKEFWDEARPGTFFSWKDIVADALGICLGCVLLSQVSY
jgi:putative lipoprotein